MKRYLITTVHPDGHCTRLQGLFASDWAAIDAALALCSNPRRICARRL